MPTLESLDAAMLSADRSPIALARLGGGQVATTGARPFRTAGTDSAVYQLRQANGRTLALRVPFTDTLNPTIADAWQRIATDPALSPVRDGRGAILLPDVRFLPDALSVPGSDSRLKRYPIMALSWVMGPTLLTTVARAAAAGDGAYLGQLAAAWATLSARLATVGFAHGDLTGDNVLVRPGLDLALVDYDTAEWAGHRAGPLNRPVTAYTHPRANASVGSRPRDAFAAVLMHASLRVLAELPALRADHGDDPAVPNGALLFSPNDLRAPESSELIAQIRRQSRAQDTLRAVDALLAACAGSPEAAPRAVASATVSSPTPPRPESPGTAQPAVATERPVSTPTPQPARSNRPLAGPPPVVDPAPASATTAPPSAWEAVAPTNRPDASRLRKEAASPRPPVPHVQPTPPTLGGPGTPPAPTTSIPPPPAARSVRPAPNAHAAPDLVRAADREQLEILLDRGDGPAALAHWRSHDLASDPAAVARYGVRLRSVEREAAVTQAQRAAQVNDSVQFLRLWERYDLAAFPPARRLHAIAEVAQRRAEAADRVRSAIATRDGATVARYWPSLRGDTLVGDIGIAAADTLQAWFGDQLGAAIARGDDRALLEVVDAAGEQGVLIPPTVRQAVRSARSRAEVRTRLDSAIRRHDQETLADLVISGRLGELGDVPPEVNRRALQALAFPALMAAIDGGRDDAILAAYDPTLFDPETGPADPLSTRERARVRLAARRLAWLVEVRDALRERDTRGLARAFSDVPDGALDRLSAVERRRIERLASREEAADSLADAIEGGDDVAIVSALTRVASIGGSLPNELDWAAVRGVVDRITLAEAIREAMTEDPPDATRLARLLPVARAAAAAEPDRTDIDFAELERQVLRAAHINRLRTAILTDDDDEIATAATPDPFNAIDRLPKEQKERVERALAARAKATGKAPRDRFIPTIYGSDAL